MLMRFSATVEQSWDLFLACCCALGAQCWWKVIFSFPVSKMGMVILILLSRRQKWVFFVCQDASVKTGLTVIKQFLLNAWHWCVNAGCCVRLSGPACFEKVFSSCLLWGGKRRRRAILGEALKVSAVTNRLRCSAAHPASPRVRVECGPQETITSLSYL